MKSLKHLLLGLTLATIAFGCGVDNVDPAASPQTISGSYQQVARPAQQCGPAMFSRLKDGITDLGSLEIINSSSNIYLIFDLNQNKYLDELKVFKGDISSLPLDSDGQVDLENFGFQSILSQPLNEYTMMSGLSTTPSCTDFVIWARITTRGIFGNITATNYAWASGSPVANGYSFNYCAPACATVNSGAQTN
jgi:hypothetical protein